MNLRGIWERIDIRPWRFAVVLLLGVPIVLVASEFARLVLPTCDAREKAALAEFSQYGGKMAGKDLDIHGDEPNWPPLQEPPPGCALEFATPQGDPEQALGYYEEKLAGRGWTVKRFPVKREGDFEYPHLEGTRDGLRYVVHSFQLPGSGVTDIRVLVYKP
jgi:hypothetical protein